MSDLRNVKASTDIDNLTRQFYCLKQLAISQESTISYYAKKDFETNERKIEAIQNSLDSELEMNATLTKENEKLEQENAKLKQEVEKKESVVLHMLERDKVRDLEQQASRLICPDKSLSDIARIEELGSELCDEMAENQELHDRIVELQEENAKLKGAVSLALNIFNDYEVGVDDYPTIDHIKNKEKLKQALEIHNLEQQAKALTEYSEHLATEAKDIPEGLEHRGRGACVYNWQMHFSREMRYRSNKLRSQAKEHKSE